VMVHLFERRIAVRSAIFLFVSAAYLQADTPLVFDATVLGHKKLPYSPDT